MVDQIVNPEALVQLKNGGFFPKRLSVIDRVESGRTPMGAVTYTTAVRAGHDQLPAALSYINTGERMTQTMTVATASRRALFAGNYPNIALDDTIRDDTDPLIPEGDRQVWKITQIDHDSLDFLTRVYLEQVET